MTFYSRFSLEKNNIDQISKFQYQFHMSLKHSVLSSLDDIYETIN